MELFNADLSTKGTALYNSHIHICFNFSSSKVKLMCKQIITETGFIGRGYMPGIHDSVTFRRHK